MFNSNKNYNKSIHIKALDILRLRQKVSTLLQIYIVQNLIHAYFLNILKLWLKRKQEELQPPMFNLNSTWMYNVH